MTRADKLASLALVDRFWSQVDKTGNCWEWTGGRTTDGYGTFWIAGKAVRAHRFSYDLNVSAIPNGQWILHECDNPACVRPDHLHLGNNLQNMREAMERGRHDSLRWGRGYHPRLKITRDQATEIRDSPLGCVTLARQYGVAKSTILRIRNGDHWTNDVQD